MRRCAQCLVHTSLLLERCSWCSRCFNAAVLKQRLSRTGLQTRAKCWLFISYLIAFGAVAGRCA